MTSELSRCWNVDYVEGRDGLSLFDHWRDGARTLHGGTSHGFPNMFFSALIQGGLHSSYPVTLGHQNEHYAKIIKEALSRGAVSVEPTEEAQDAWVEEIRRTAIDMAAAVRDCTPGYYNGEGEEKARFPLGEIYGPGWFAFLDLLEDWRAGGMEGLVFRTA